MAILVANPAASQFTGGVHRSVALALSQRFEVEALWPNSPGEARAIAARAASDGAGIVVAMGGDGVVHHVAQGLIGSATPLGIIPVGTTNVIARLTGLPARPGAAVKLITGSHSVTPQPVLDISAVTAQGPMHRSALFALGVGPDAAIVKEADSEPYRKYRFGGLHYARTAVGVARRDLRKRRPVATARANSRCAEVIGMMVQLRDSYTYFGRIPMRFSPQPPDPLTVLAVTGLRVRRTPAILRGALGRRGMGDVKGFEVWEGVSEAAIGSPEPLLAQADGELLGEISELEAKFRPDGYQLVVPDVTRP